MRGTLLSISDDKQADVIVAFKSISIYLDNILNINNICFYNMVKVRKVAKIRNRYNQLPHLTQDTTWESNKNTIKHHKEEPRGQPFPSR